MLAWHALSPELSQHHRGVDACNLSNWEVETGRSERKVTRLYSECKNSLRYATFCQKVGGDEREDGREGKGRGEER